MMAALPEFLGYHYLSGFGHAFVYANGQPAAAQAVVAPFKALGIATVVDWHWPPEHDGEGGAYGSDVRAQA